LALLARWHGEAAATAHAPGAAARAFGDQLQPILASPFEVRSFDGLSVERPAGPGGPMAVWVLTHIDVFPAGKDRVADLARSLAEAGRSSEGNLRFDVLRWAGHPNHFTLVEWWCHRDAFEASAMAAPTREFRQQLTPLEGALYDERLYHALR
jgi:quinol monooxygenase YgiN